MDIRTYFEIADTFLHVNKKDYKDFAKYIRKNKLKYTSVEELAKNFHHFFTHTSHTYFTQIETYSKIIVFCGFVTGFLLGIFCFKETININLFLLVSIVFPFVLMLFSGFRILSYRFPVKKEKTFLERFLPKEFELQSEDTHLLKTYLFIVFQKTAIGYALGIVFSTIFLFFVNKVDFNYDNTYNLSVEFEQKIIDFFAFGWSHIAPVFVPHLEHIEQNRSGFAFFILLSILFWNILPRFLLLLVAYKKYNRSLKNAFEVKTKELVMFLQNSVRVEGNSASSIPKFKETQQKTADSCLDIETVFLLFYEMPPCEIELDEKIVQEKPKKSFAVAAFDMDEAEEQKIIDTLSNLVIIFPSPQTLPDESFKSFVKKILQNPEVTQIWVVVTTEEEDSLKVALKTDKNYNEWHYQINEVIDDLRVRLYHER